MDEDNRQRIADYIARLYGPRLSTACRVALDEEPSKLWHDLCTYPTCTCECHARPHED